jgi:hypothetical protein
VTWSTKEILSRERDRGYAPESNRLGRWKREGDSVRELAKERDREKNKSGLKISNWQELGGFVQHKRV